MRRKIAAGEKLFNTRPLTISNVRGLTDNAALAKALGTTVPIAPFQGFCATCHDAPNVGDHSLPLALDIGTGHDPSAETDPLIANGLSQLSYPELPIFKITGCPDPFADPTKPSTTPFVILTTDPGKGLVTGLCSDVSRTKGPILRGLAARAPYFSQWSRPQSQRAPRFLQPAVPDESDRTRKRPTHRISEFALVWSAVACHRFAISTSGKRKRTV